MSCGSSHTVPIGTIFRKSFLTKGSSGLRVDADATPMVVNLQLNGADASGITPTITQAQDNASMNITGKYNIEVDTSALNHGDNLSLLISSTIEGVVRDCVMHLNIQDSKDGPQLCC